MDDAQNVLPQSLPCRVLTDSISSSNYYVQFYSQQMAVMPIPANQWFLLTMQLRSPQALQFQIANRFLQIQLYTVSSVWANAVVYDDNLAFNYLQLSSAPSGLIGLTITPFNNKPGVEMLIESQYSVYLDILLNLPSYFFSQTIVLHL